MRAETRCRHMGYSFRLTAMVILYAPSHRQDSTYHGLCYTSRGAYRIAHSTAFVTPVEKHCLEREIAQWVHPMKDRSYDPSHYERTLLPRRYISLSVIGKSYQRHQVTVLCMGFGYDHGIYI